MCETGGHGRQQLGDQPPVQMKLKVGFEEISLYGGKDAIEESLGLAVD